MIYFDNAATSFPKAPGVGPEMARFLAESAANPGRSGHRLAVAVEQMLDDARLLLARMFGGQDHHRLVFTLNCTDALNMGLKGVLSSLKRPHVITTVLEHNSVSRPLVAMAQAGRIDLTRVDCDDQGFVDPDAIAKAINPKTRMIVMTHASNVLGTIQDVAAVGRIARAHDLLFCVDAAQTAGLAPISVEAMNIDLLAFPGHKSLLGPTGTGGLYVGPRCPQPPTDDDAAGLTAWREGGTGGDSSTPTQPPLFPYYLEGGTPNTVGIAGLAEGARYVLTQGLDRIRTHEQKMVQVIIDRLADDDRFTVYGCRQASRRVGTVSFNIRGYEAPDAGAILDDSFEIAVRPGLHCSPYIHRKLNTFPNGAIRISPGPFNTDEELVTLLDALDQLATAAV